MQFHQYTVVLKNNFYPLFASKQRIVNECFSKFNFVDNEDKLNEFIKLAKELKKDLTQEGISIGINDGLMII